MPPALQALTAQCPCLVHSVPAPEPPFSSPFGLFNSSLEVSLQVTSLGRPHRAPPGRTVWLREPCLLGLALCQVQRWQRCGSPGGPTEPPQASMHALAWTGWLGPAPFCFSCKSAPGRGGYMEGPLLAQPQRRSQGVKGPLSECSSLLPLLPPGSPPSLPWALHWPPPRVSLPSPFLSFFILFSPQQPEGSCEKQREETK